MIFWGVTSIVKIDYAWSKVALSWHSSFEDFSEERWLVFVIDWSCFRSSRRLTFIITNFDICISCQASYFRVPQIPLLVVFSILYVLLEFVMPFFLVILVKWRRIWNGFDCLISFFALRFFFPARVLFALWLSACIGISSFQAKEVLATVVSESVNEWKIEKLTFVLPEN